MVFDAAPLTDAWVPPLASVPGDAVTSGLAFAASFLCAEELWEREYQEWNC